MALSNRWERPAASAVPTVGPTQRTQPYRRSSALQPARRLEKGARNTRGWRQRTKLSHRLGTALTQPPTFDTVRWQETEPRYTRLKGRQRARCGSLAMTRRTRTRHGTMQHEARTARRSTARHGAAARCTRRDDPTRSNAGHGAASARCGVSMHTTGRHSLAPTGSDLLPSCVPFLS